MSRAKSFGGAAQFEAAQQIWDKSCRDGAVIPEVPFMPTSGFPAWHSDWVEPAVLPGGVWLLPDFLWIPVLASPYDSWGQGRQGAPFLRS